MFLQIPNPSHLYSHNRFRYEKKLNQIPHTKLRTPKHKQPRISNMIDGQWISKSDGFMHGDTFRSPIWESCTKIDTSRSAIWKVCKNWDIQISDLSTCGTEFAHSYQSTKIHYQCYQCPSHLSVHHLCGVTVGDLTIKWSNDCLRTG